ncbi:E3 ubiquitin-protein ligase RNF14-like [Saccostrea echinata]|uniref:E3 ubiquitin-protein ligase RNF14-like n=1 Tax=Saccostrea echinata TaxID=191078 RepID=UPI002A8065AC|nr:E3 ubiquitin-protein ligase RNF14-like [Saccostrea echinata]
MATGGVAHGCQQWALHHKNNYLEQSDEVLALESIYEPGKGVVGLNVLSRPEIKVNGEPKDGIFSIQLAIPVDNSGRTVTVDICMPSKELEKDVDYSVFRRSDSGMRIIGSVSVKYLYPISLTIVLPHEYPSSASPKFTMSCPWLTSPQMTSLCHMLDRLWEESMSMPVLFTWITWLQENVTEYLGLRDKVLLQDDFEDGDNRVISDHMQIEEAVTNIMRYDQHRDEEEFQQNEQECGICFDQQTGTGFLRLWPCKHHFCQDCVNEHCRTHIKDGNVLNLLCPETDCKSEIPPSVVLSNLTAEECERYETLSLRKGLDCMGDIVWCPRCQNPVIREKEAELKLGHCVACFYSFCTECQEPWHQGKCYAELEENVQELSESQKAAKMMEDKRQRRLARKREEKLSRDIIAKTSQPCPNCKMDISKMAGCNKVTCIYCNHSMCWACGKDITKESYGHFGICTLTTISTQFEENNFYNDGGVIDVPVMFRPVHLRDKAPNPIAAKIEMTLAVDPEQKNNLLRCPFCKQKNLRNNNDNHIRCWNCSRSSCFQCKKAISENPITKHFSPPSLCKQHSS